MKTKLLIPSLALLSFQTFFAQEIKVQPKDTIANTADTLKIKSVEIKATPVVNTATVLTNAEIDAKKNAENDAKKLLKEQKKLEKEQKKLEKEQKAFEKQQNKIASGEKDLIKLKKKLTKAEKKSSKSTAKFLNNQSKGKLSAIEIEEENITISKLQIKVHELQDDIAKKEKKLNKIR